MADDRDRAELHLRRWAADNDAVQARRDPVIVAAVRAGISTVDIQRITGVARTTIARIIERERAAENDS